MIKTKKTLTFALAATLFAQSAITPPPAHALVAAGLGIAGVAAGGAVALVGSGIFVAGAAGVLLTPDDDGENWGVRLDQVLFAGGIAAVGIIVLDQGHGGTISYSAITPEQGTALGITDTRVLDVYNNEVPQINAIRETIASQMSERQARRQSISVADSAALWSQYAADLSPESFEVMRAIVGQKTAQN